MTKSQCSKCEHFVTRQISIRQSNSFQTPLNRPENGTDILATKKSGSNALWFLLVRIYQRQSLCSSTSCKCKRSKGAHHNSCCECWRGHAPVCLERIGLSYWYLSCDKRLTYRTFVTQSNLKTYAKNVVKCFAYIYSTLLSIKRWKCLLLL
jgi:hypothetical protein